MTHKYNHLVKENSKLKAEKFNALYRGDTAHILNSHLISFIDFLLYRVLVHFIDITPIEQNLSNFYQDQIQNNADLDKCLNTCKNYYFGDVGMGVYESLNNDSEYECQIQNSNIHYEPFPKYYHYKNQFTVAFNWNTDQIICKKLLTISNDGENPTNYIRNAVYHYLTHVNIKL